MKAGEVHKMTTEELAAEAERLSRKLFDLKVSAVTEKIEDPSQFRKMRADVARLKTELRARTLGLAGRQASAIRPAEAPAGKPAKSSARKPAAAKAPAKSGAKAASPAKKPAKKNAEVKN
ncbi:MAG: 50S ribosomal protein L29 [Phycisphaerales bacterium]|nr:50S ribosomal protein L29 [Phycisphaerales bacterium]